MLFLADPPELLHSNAKQAQIAEASFQDHSHSHIISHLRKAENVLAMASSFQITCKPFWMW
jgi:hypothetical protein